MGGSKMLKVGRKKGKYSRKSRELKGCKKKGGRRKVQKEEGKKKYVERRRKKKDA